MVVAALLAMVFGIMSAHCGARQAMDLLQRLGKKYLGRFRAFPLQI